MKNATNMPFYKVAIWSFAAVTMLAGCSKKDKKDDAPAPVAVEIEEVDVSSANGEGTFTYSSNITNAKFKCKIEYNGQAAEWQSCPKNGKKFPTPAGVPYIFSVKAIAPNGDETEVQTVQGGVSDGQQLELVAEILGKEAIVGSVYNQATLSVQFATKGANVNPAELRYECRRENETEFRRCPTGDVYDFGQLLEETPYGLAVRSVHDLSKSISSEDSITFTVQLPKLEIDGLEELEQKKTGKVDLAFNRLLPGTKVNCKINGTQDVDCTNGLPLDLSQFPAGSHKIDVEAKNSAGSTVATTVINFCAQRCDSGTGGAAPMTQVFQIGSFYNFLVPDNMHVTQYATTKTFNNQLSFYRVTAESDPYYLGNYGCYRDFDRKISASAPDGTVYDYCHTTPQRDAYKWLTDFRLANNHIELATNEQYISGYEHDRIMINVFDTDYEFMHDRSRFEQLCMNKRGTIQKSPAIRFIDRNFWGENVKAEFYMCVAELASSGPGLPQAGDEWWIGAFFITNEGLNMPQYECFRNDWKKIVHSCDGSCVVQQGYDPQWCGNFKNPGLLEVVFMTKTPYREAADFARAAQAQFVKNLQEVVPLR